MSSAHTLVASKLTYLVNGWVALCLVGLLCVPSAYVWAGFVAALVGLVLIFRQKLGHSSECAQHHAVLFGKLSWITVVFALVGMMLEAYHASHAGAYEMYIPFLWAPFVWFALYKGRLNPSVFWVALAWGAIASGLFAWVQVSLWGIERPQGFIGSPITYGNTGVVLGSLSLMGWLYAPQNKWRHPWQMLMLMGFAGGVLTSFISASKGGWASIILAVVWVIFTGVQGITVRQKVFMLLLSLGMVVGLALSPVSPVQHRLADALHGLEGYLQTGKPADGSVGPRLELWKFVLKSWHDHPVAGHGKEGLMQSKQDLIDQGTLDPMIAPFGSMHNEALHHLVEKGLLGLSNWILMMALLIWGFARYVKHDHHQVRVLAQTGVLLVCLYLEFGLSDTIFVLNTNRHVFTFLVMALMALLAQKLAVASTQQPRLQPTLNSKNRA